MLTIKYQAAFKKDYKRIKKRGYDVSLLKDVIQRLASKQSLPEKNKDDLILYLTRTGTHSDLF